MDKPLYEISTQYESAYLALADSELPQEAIDDTLEALEGEIEEKAISVAKFVGNMESQARSIGDASKQMQARKKVLENRATRIRDYLRENMQRTGISEVTCPYFQIKLKKNPPSVVIEDETKVPDKYKVEKVVTSIDKTAIKKDGGCEGAKIESGMRVEIK